ncbi:MAG: hypothetical protein QME59_07775, partial [Candidatus Hydrothermarchaeota archaeon]|nr:hypothetical protein [Candidatus Hydrothermarchaeota archaeon]
EEVANLLHMKKEDLTAKGIKAYLTNKLHEIRAEITSLHLKYKVSSLEELDKKINKGEFSESETFEDFTKLDYLESEEEKLRRILESLD